MFTIIRLTLLGIFCAYLVSFSSFTAADLPMPDIAAAPQSESILPNLEEGKVTDFLAEVQNFCSNYVKLCELRDAALHMAHVQAVTATGALHDWLAEGLDEG